MDKLATELANLLQKIQDPAMEAVRNAAFFEGLSLMMKGIFFLVIADITLLGGVKGLRNQDFWGLPIKDRQEVGAVFFGLGTVFLIFGLWYIFDPWTWAHLFAPDSVVAKRLLRW
jgi:hypothetical protein